MGIGRRRPDRLRERAAGPKSPMLRKPFRIDDLQAVVGEALNGRS
jgi:hypothetical protein